MKKRTKILLPLGGTLLVVAPIVGFTTNYYLKKEITNLSKILESLQDEKVTLKSQLEVLKQNHSSMQSFKNQIDKQKIENFNEANEIFKKFLAMTKVELEAPIEGSNDKKGIYRYLVSYKEITEKTKDEQSFSSIPFVFENVYDKDNKKINSKTEEIFNCLIPEELSNITINFQTKVTKLPDFIKEGTEEQKKQRSFEQIHFANQVIDKIVTEIQKSTNEIVLELQKQIEIINKSKELVKQIEDLKFLIPGLDMEEAINFGIDEKDTIDVRLQKVLNVLKTTLTLIQKKAAEQKSELNKANTEIENAKTLLEALIQDFNNLKREMENTAK